MKHVVLTSLAVLGLMLGIASLTLPAEAYTYLHPPHQNEGNEGGDH